MNLEFVDLLSRKGGITQSEWTCNIYQLTASRICERFALFSHWMNYPRPELWFLYSFSDSEMRYIKISYLEDVKCTFLSIRYTVSFLRHSSRIWHDRLPPFKVECISWPVNQIFCLFSSNSVIILVLCIVHICSVQAHFCWFLLSTD